MPVTSTRLKRAYQPAVSQPEEETLTQMDALFRSFLTSMLQSIAPDILRDGQVPYETVDGKTRPALHEYDKRRAQFHEVFAGMEDKAAHLIQEAKMNCFQITDALWRVGAGRNGKPHYCNVLWSMRRKGTLHDPELVASAQSLDRVLTLKSGAPALAGVTIARVGRRFAIRGWPAQSQFATREQVIVEIPKSKPVADDTVHQLRVAKCNRMLEDVMLRVKADLPTAKSALPHLKKAIAALSSARGDN